MAKQVTRSIIVKAPLPAVYNLWANFENFPRFMEYIKSVTMTGSNTSHWVMKGPMGVNVDWNAEVTRLEENKRIGWSSKDNKGFITTSGQVTFNSLPQGETEVTVTVQYDVPAGKAGEAIAALFANPEQRLLEDLRNFKAIAEGMPERAAAGTETSE
ncbi:MAG TPA: SRPBCC family protein [Anaerolineae bacterium]